MVNRAFWGDIKKLLDGIERPENCQQRLYMAGLYRLKGQPVRYDSSAEFIYERNEYAVALILIHREKYDELRERLLDIVEERE